MYVYIYIYMYCPRVGLGFRWLTPTINPKLLVHNIVPPSNEASIGPRNMKWLLENFPPPNRP